MNARSLPLMMPACRQLIAFQSRLLASNAALELSALAFRALIAREMASMAAPDGPNARRWSPSAQGAAILTALLCRQQESLRQAVDARLLHALQSGDAQAISPEWLRRRQEALRRRVAVSERQSKRTD